MYLGIAVFRPNAKIGMLRNKMLTYKFWNLHCLLASHNNSSAENLSVLLITGWFVKLQEMVRNAQSYPESKGTLHND